MTPEEMAATVALMGWVCCGDGYVRSLPDGWRRYVSTDVFGDPYMWSSVGVESLLGPAPQRGDHHPKMLKFILDNKGWPCHN